MTDLGAPDNVVADRGTGSLALAAANIAFVRQAVALLESIDDGAYTRTAPPVYNSAVGAHLRHVLDHYVRFLADFRTGAVDYDARSRDRRIETDRRAALAAANAVIDGLAELTAVDLERALRVAMDCDAGFADDTAAAMAPYDRIEPNGLTDGGHGCPSTVRRELIFLVSHTVHHYALIAVMLRHQAVGLPADFGVAPSTLRHQRRLAASRA